MKWEWQLTPESLERQVAFFNKVLHGPDAIAAKAVDCWPQVRLHVTDKHYAGSWRSEDAYPLSRTVRTKYFLGENSELTDRPLLADKINERVQYDAKSGSASWKVTFAQPTEITGSSMLHLRFSISEGSDADIFVTLQKLNREGNIVAFPFHTFINDGHVAYGWLRASKRTLDVHSYGDEVTYTFLEKDVKLLVLDESVSVDINIQPSATLFRKGETLQVVVQGRDFGTYGPMCQVPRAGTGCNEGVHTINFAESYLEVPIIPRD